MSVYFYRYYAMLCRFLYRWRFIVTTGLILAFGLPVFLLPERIEADSSWAEWYNRTLGSERYKEDIAPRSEEHTSELQSRENLVCRLLLEKKKQARPRDAAA